MMTNPIPDIPYLVRDMLRCIGEDPTRLGLRETPGRVERAWMKIFSGYREKPCDILTKNFRVHTDDDIGMVYDEMILLRDIEFYSTCEHHLLPFFGKAHVAYIPSTEVNKAGLVVGVSKLARLVDCFARRLQIQERMGAEIADALFQGLGAKGVGVVLEAQHLCMMARGVEKQNSVMVTSALRGVFKTDATTRAEFMALAMGRREK